MLEFLRNLCRPRPRQLTCAGKTDPGMVRESNEDAFAIHPERRLFLVADGMGGHNAGEIASLATVKVIGDQLSPAILKKTHGKGQEIRHAMIKSFTMANELVIALAAEKEEWRGMGCTLVMVHVDDATLHVCHVGDARCYLLSAGTIQQITTDHTTLAEMNYDISDDRTLNEPRYNRHVVTRVIGYPFPEPPDYLTCPFLAGDRLLLCTDGLWSMVDQPTLEQVLRESEHPEDAVDRLIDLANGAGGSDNITGVAVFG